MNNLEFNADCAAYADAIAAMTVEAFAREYGTGDAEAALVAALRADGDVVVELAALENKRLVGHILFSRASDEPSTGRVAALAPMCARIDRRNLGIGGALIREGLARCRARGIAAVVVFGNPAYYGRFGFSVALAKNISCDYAGPHFQALEFEAGAASTIARVTYAPAFAATEV